MIGDKFELYAVIVSPVRWFDELRITENAYPENKYKLSMGWDTIRYITLEISQQERKEFLNIMANNEDDSEAQNWVIYKAMERGLMEEKGNE